MKLKLTSLAVLFLFLISIAPAYSQEEADLEQEEIEKLAEETTDTINIEDIGATPDKAGYGLKIALERARLALAFNKEKRAELALKYADRRLNEARLMALENKFEYLQKVREEHKKLIEKANINLDSSGENAEDLDKKIEFENEIELQEGKIEDMENLILIKNKGLNEEQRQKLLELIESFRIENSNLKLKFDSNKEELKIRLKAKGLSEEEIEGKAVKFEENSERFAAHQVNQAEKMFELASKLIRKSGPRNLSSIEETRSLNAKAGEKLKEAKEALNNKEYLKAVELSKESKKLSALTIASIHGKNKGLVEGRIKSIEDLKKMKLGREGLVKDTQKNERDKIKDRLKELNEKRKEKSGKNQEEADEESEDNETSG